MADSLPLDSLIDTCRRLRHSLAAGLMVRDVFRQLADRGPAPVRPTAALLAADLQRGNSLEDALLRHGSAFPPLFVNLVGVGERTGSLPEVLGELENYYQLRLQLRRQFITQITMPAVQFVGAVFVIALLLLVVGMIGSMTGTKPLDPLGLGLTGPVGALTFLAIVVGTLAGIYGIYRLAARSMQQDALMDAVFLILPALGPCMQALALARFSLALHLAQQAGLAIAEGAQLSLESTGNAAFAREAAEVAKHLRAGHDLAGVLSHCGLFPPEYIDVIAVGEQSGRLAEVMKQQAAHYQDEAGRRMTTLTRAAGFAVWLVVALLIIVTIFRIFGTYLSMIDSLGR